MSGEGAAVEGASALRAGAGAFGDAAAGGHARARVADLQRGRLIAAMIDVVGERGLANVSVAHVVARAGVSRRTFYEIFEDSEACFLAAFEYVLECATAPALEAYGRERRWQERIRASLAALLCFFEDQPAMGRLLLGESSLAGPRVQVARARAMGELTAAVEEGAAEGKASGGWPPVIAEGTVAAVLSVIYTRLIDPERPALEELVGPLMSLIVLPYLGAAAARRELERPPPPRTQRPARVPAGPPKRSPLETLDMRLTYRTMRVLGAIAAKPGSSNREVGGAAEVIDQGQISKLLARLLRLGLIENVGEPAKGAANAWVLSSTGAEVHALVQISAGPARAAG